MQKRKICIPNDKNKKNAYPMPKIKRICIPIPFSAPLGHSPPWDVRPPGRSPPSDVRPPGTFAPPDVRPPGTFAPPGPSPPPHPPRPRPPRPPPAARPPARPARPASEGGRAAGSGRAGGVLVRCRVLYKRILPFAKGDRALRPALGSSVANSGVAAPSGINNRESHNSDVHQDLCIACQICQWTHLMAIRLCLTHD